MYLRQLFLLALLNALTSVEDAWIARLWQAALTVSRHAVVQQSVEKLAIAAMLAMDRQATTAGVMDESWPPFALKIVLATRSKEQNS